ncbi:MAG: molybdopterin molybdotransferase MoeA [Micavibrio aeruginosavorus]|nr:molybdopterin molybdotransferase MoeA [Micavibrio aeruginosavorus]
MISYDEALNILCKEGAKKLLPGESVDVMDIPGRICAATIRAAIANQPFDNSAMDGFALRTEELQNAANDNPVALTVSGHIAAGELRRFSAPGKGQCYEIMTGAPLPPGCDAVVPVEKIEKGADGKILFRAGARAGENIRRAGEDFKTGDSVTEKGTVLAAGHVLALATLGVGRVEVVRPVKVALVSTGQEVIDSFDMPLEYGQIYNSTRPYLMAAMSQPGIEAVSAGTVRDEPQEFRARMEGLIAQGVDLCLSTGAVSAGVHDFVPSVLREMGAEIFFHKVAIRPGKPLLFAKFPDGGPFYVGLPGNPASTAAGFRFFVQPLLRAMQGLPPETPEYAVLKNDYVKGDAPLRFFMRAMRGQDSNGGCTVEIPQKQQSFMVGPFAAMNAWAVIPESVTRLKAGDLVEIRQ